MDPLPQAFIAHARHHLQDRMSHIEHCLSQLDDTQIWYRPAPSLNSIGNLLLHLEGNLRQWVVAGVGNRPDQRNRPGEFSAHQSMSGPDLLKHLQAAVADADDTLARLDPATLLDARSIQGFDSRVFTAIFDCLAHLSGHVQEISLLTRLQLGESYRFAWVPTTPEQGAPPSF